MLITKIDKWKELNGKDNGQYGIVVDSFSINLYREGILMISVSKQLPYDVIIKTLLLYGFDVRINLPMISRFEQMKRDCTVEEFSEKVHEGCSTSACVYNCVECRVKWFKELIRDEGGLL